MNAETQYLEILRDLVNSDVKQENRTGVDTYKIPPRMIQHDMSKGFPLLTTKRVAWKTMKVELEGFIKGITSKKWFQDRGCKIWDEWSNPKRVPYGNDEDSKAKMVAEDDLGLIYGSQWRNFHDPKNIGWDILNDKKIEGGKVDQLENIIETLNKNPTDRRMICLAWNPLALDYQALPACHVLFRVGVTNGKLDLTWYQRSVDTFLGLSFNLASYALLLHLIAKETGFEEGILTGFLDDLHLYENHIDQAKEQLSREPYELPYIETENFKSIFEWEHDDTLLFDYKCHPSIKAPVAV